MQRGKDNLDLNEFARAGVRQVLGSRGDKWAKYKGDCDQGSDDRATSCGVERRERFFLT